MPGRGGKGRGGRCVGHFENKDEMSRINLTLHDACPMKSKVRTGGTGHGWRNPIQEEDDEADFQSGEGVLDVEADPRKQYPLQTNYCRTNPKPVKI